jgi:transcriptional regulator with XRE-family HTH domain
MGSALRNLRKRKGVTQAEIADHCEVSPPSVSKWENQGIPPARISELAEFLDVPEEELRGEAEGAGEAYVESGDDIPDWRNTVAMDDLPDMPKLVLLTVPAFWDEWMQACPVTRENLLEEVGLPVEEIDEAVEGALATDYLERISDVEWVFRLRMPKSAE